MFEKHLFLAEVKRWLMGRPGVRGAMMSGSGSTMFAVVEDEGTGRALMEELFHRMQERKVRVIHLDVRLGNTPARNLYESLGFVQDGLRKGYYDLPKEDAVLMSRTDESVPKR